MQPSLDSLLSTTFSPPHLQERSLVVGLGGGCDIITALAVRQWLSSSKENIFWGNAKTSLDHDLVVHTKHIGQLHTHGTELPKNSSLKIERQLPIDPWGPLIFAVHKGVRAQTLSEEIQSIKFSQVIAIDTGGDVLLPQHGAPKGRDQQLLAAIALSGIPTTVLVAGLGADGQNQAYSLAKATLTYQEQGHFLGAFSLSPLLETYKQYAKILAMHRTPNIILSAFETTDLSMIVQRERSPEIPTHWLRSGLAFTSGIMPLNRCL